MKASIIGGSASSAVSGSGSSFSTLFSAIPPWLTILLGTLAVLALSALAGHILGRVYCAVRYPNPDKPAVLSVRQRFLFLGVLVLVCYILISSFSSIAKKKTVSANGVAGSNQKGESITLNGAYKG